MSSIDNLVSAIDGSAHAFLQPLPSLHVDALSAVKTLLDPLAASIADEQKLRRDDNRRKRKRGDYDHEDRILRLRQVYISGLGIKQVWEQSRRILDAACDEVERLSEEQGMQKEIHQTLPTVINGHLTNEKSVEPNESSDEEIWHNQFDEDISDEEGFDEESLESGGAVEDDVEDLTDDGSNSNFEASDPITYSQDPHKLNDGFFSIDHFNKQTQFLEQQDARGEDDNPSDEDEIDWDVDPLTMSFHKPKIQPGRQANKAAAEADEDEFDEESGPTFGDADLGTADSDEDFDVGGIEEDAEGVGMSGLTNTNDIRYADFFAPPPKKPSKTKRMRALPKTQPENPPTTASDDEADLGRAMADVRRDLLDSESEPSDLDFDGDGKYSTKNMSTHEKQRAQIAAEIRELEAANVAKRDWTLSGEARAADRPLNSLIEEDLEFERAGKPVPVITAEVSEQIEDLIKRRIIAREFDEVVRRLPEGMGNTAEQRRGRVELDDTKNTQGLAEVYEQEHLKATDPGYIDKRSVATKKAHEEISKLWKEVSAQLDVLSNLHFKPKRVEAEIKVIEDKPTISMEDARPVGNEGGSMLAPQEVYRPGEDRRRTNDGLVVNKAGMSENKEEMSREEKLRKRRRQKERMKKAGLNKPAVVVDSARAGDGKPKGKRSKEAEQQDILTQLRKGNVKVIDKKGELTDVSGTKRRRGDLTAGGAGAYKL